MVSDVEPTVYMPYFNIEVSMACSNLQCAGLAMQAFCVCAVWLRAC